MNDRQNKLLNIIIEEYVQNAQPVGSKLIVEKYFNNISSATIRNDMAELEHQEYIFQPHTSAGRIPTEKAYDRYINEDIDYDKHLNNADKQHINDAHENIKQSIDNETHITKELAKVVAEKSGLAVLVGFGAHDVFYTGLSNLFHQPEFQDMSMVIDITKVVDHLDEVMSGIYNQITDLQIKIGQNNPFSADCSVVLIKKNNILFGIMGPIRMNYQYNVSLINNISNKI